MTAKKVAQTNVESQINNRRIKLLWIDQILLHLEFVIA